MAARLGIFLDDAGKKQSVSWPENQGVWEFDENDYLLYALLCDNVYCPELLCEDPTNREYSGMYIARDYQYPLNRPGKKNYRGYTCARSVGKTESIKNKALTHGFRRIGENLLISTPELIHLLPLTDSIEDRIMGCRLTREFLDTDQGRTGFTHRPFGVDYKDGTKIVGRIPRITGIGVKGQHQPDLIIDEGQDYPDAGWREVHEPLPLDTPVLTPVGFVEMGRLRRGDRVIAIDGSATQVEGIFPQGEREVLRVHLSDGSVVECDEGHYWKVRPRVGRSWRRMTAGEIERSGRSWFVPELCGAIELEGTHGSLDPYLLGLLLGDGSLSRVSVYLSTADQEIVDSVRAILPSEDELIHVDRYDYRMRTRVRSRHTRTHAHTELERLGLTGHRAESKFIPEEYLYAPIASRLALLQGLVDSDGNIDKSGAVRWGSCSRRLADGMRWLIRSLGGRCSFSMRPDHRGHRTMFTIHFRLPAGLYPARLSRKRARVAHTKMDVMTRRIVRIERTGATKPMQCIQVAHREHLFMVTENLVASTNTVMKDHTGADGLPDFNYEFYGVHSGARDTGFYSRATTGGFAIVQITALQRPGWCAAEKEAAKAAYGGTNSPDYRRNILGEPGAAASPLFVTARLVACMDQDRASAYNTTGYVFQEIHVEAFDELMLPIADVLDLPSGMKRVWGGGDIGLTNAPTVFHLFHEHKVDSVMRMELVRRIHLHRMRVKQIRFAMYALFNHFGEALQGFGVDETGLGFPMFQEIEDDEFKPAGMETRFRGFFFNSKVPVGLERGMVTQDSAGNWRDQYGAAVTVRENPLTLEPEYIVWMPMIEASTRYLREMVDTTFLRLPFDPGVIGDMQGDTAQRVKRIAGLKNKPNAFHDLDAMRGFAMVYKSGEVEAAIREPEQLPVLEVAW